ncbi:MAG: COG4315 family predicted lipoprotein [Solirubrobacterales bacterium]
MSLPRVTTALCSLAALALIVAGCGGGGSSNTTTNGENAASSSEAPASSGSGMTVSTGEVPGLGTVLVDSEGLTVYQFAKDQGSTSSCYGACEQGWPPVIAKGKPSGEGEMASQLGTTKRKDGTMQVTFAGHPLYTYAGDTEPGEANGNESTAFGGKWSALNESGEVVSGSAGGGSAAAPEESEGSASGGSESSGGGYGY